MTQIITAKYIFDGKNLLQNTAVVINNHLIADILPTAHIADKSLLKNYGDCIITSGFIDLQLNGCGGVLFNDNISHDTLETMYQTCLKYGTTSFLPTLITCDFKDVITALECIKSWFDKYSDTHGIIGLHLEGPFIAEAKKGIHPQKFIIEPTNSLLAQIVAYRQFFPIKMTIAPEVFSSEQIKYLINNNIIIALGHSNATYTETATAINLGVQAATHMFNAMSGLSSRNPGVIGAVLNSNIYSGVIADLLHVDKANIQLLNKVKPDRVYLVTDAVTPMGTNMQQFQLGGKTLHIKNGMCLDENNVLGGAYLTMPQAVSNCVNACGINIEQALKMASQIPAQVMGYHNKLGKISHNYRADLIAFNLQKQTCQIIS